VTSSAADAAPAHSDAGRIVSLLPSATEIVYALGLDGRLDGVTDECDFPPAARDKRVVVRSHQPGGLSAGEIDAWVLDSIVTVARAADVTPRGLALRATLQDRLDAITRAVAGRPPVATLVLEWLDPPFTPGHWIPDVVAAAGGLALLGAPGARSTATDWDTVRATRPEVVVLAPCGTDPADIWAQAHLVPADLLPSRSFAADLARPGPRLVDAVEALAAVLHPQAGLPLRPDVLLPQP
jgi:ABC-type Fe3+-hydroxamate transport system substrate-binding protein